MVAYGVTYRSQIKTNWIFWIPNLQLLLLHCSSSRDYNCNRTHAHRWIHCL